MHQSEFNAGNFVYPEIDSLLKHLTPDGYNRFRIHGMVTTRTGFVEIGDLARALTAAQAFPVADGCIRALSGTGMRFTLDGNPETTYLPLGDAAEWLGVSVSVIEFADTMPHRFPGNPA